MSSEDCVIAIDIGGTQTKLGLVDRKGSCLLQESFDTPPSNLSDFLVTLKSRITALKKKATHRSIIGLSIGAPAVDRLSECVVFPPNLPWPSRTPIGQLLSDEFHLPSLLLNDAEAAALGELAYGRAKGLPHFIYITLGTGLGAACVLNGSLIEGTKGISMELGHMCFRKGGRSCGCGKKGCLESYVSATALKRNFLQLYAQSPTDSLLSEASIHQLSARDIIEAAQSSDPLAQGAIQQTATWLGEALSHVVQITGITDIFLAGGLARSAKLMLPTIQQSIEEHLMPMLRSQVQVAVSSLLSDNPALLGAAYYFFQRKTRSSASENDQEK